MLFIFKLRYLVLPDDICAYTAAANEQNGDNVKSHFIKINPFNKSWKKDVIIIVNI